MKKKVIYTVNVGGYDNILQPLCVDKSFDYICFSNDINEGKNGIWEIRKIPQVVSDSQTLSRYPKMNPHLMLAEYEYSVYMDANLVISDIFFYNRINDLIKNNVQYAGMDHVERNCSYEEGFRVWRAGKEKRLSIIIKQLRYMRKAGFPYNWGMYEANVIFRNHHNIDVIKVSEKWWWMFCNFAKRDQISHSFCLWSYNVPLVYILGKGYNTHNHYCIKFTEHPNRKTTLRNKKYPYLRYVYKFSYQIFKVFLVR